MHDAASYTNLWLSTPPTEEHFGFVANQAHIAAPSTTQQQSKPCVPEVGLLDNPVLKTRSMNSQLRPLAPCTRERLTSAPLAASQRLIQTNINSTAGSAIRTAMLGNDDDPQSLMRSPKFDNGTQQQFSHSNPSTLHRFVCLFPGCEHLHFRQLKSLNRHCKSKHFGKPALQCPHPDCQSSPETYARQDNLQKHFKKSHQQR